MGTVPSRDLLRHGRVRVTGGGCELNVAIRTVEFDAAGGAVLGVGGGITADSDVDAEWQECLHKAASIVGAHQSRERSTAS